MQAIELTKPQEFRMIDVPQPEEPSPGDAIVRVHRVGICGTDYAGFLGKMPFFSYPRIPGHELGVEVVAVGDGVINVKPGDRCAIEPYINCQNCYSCERGHTNCCMNHQTLGVHCDGGLRSHFTIPARKLHISRKLEYKQLALVETLAIGCHAIDRAQVQPNQTVLVIGAGPIGLSVMEFAKLAGARCIVMDLNAERLEFVRTKMSIADTIQSQGQEADIKEILKLTDGRYCDVVVDATGSVRSMSTALEYVAFAGKLVFVGITSQELAIPHPLMHRREISVLASRNALSKDFTAIIDHIENGRIDTQPWITHETPFAEMIDAFPNWLKPESHVVKAIVEL